MAIQKLTLKQWIEKEGVQTVSKVLKVTESAVRHWRRGYTLPSDDLKLKILKLSKGAVQIESMIVQHYSPKNKNRYRA